MNEYDFACIEIHLQTPDGDDSHLVYKQVIPVSVLTNYDHHWFAKIIAIINKLEVPNV